MNPVAVQIGNFSIYWYSLFILMAFIIGFLLVKKEIKRHKDINEDFLYDYFFWLVPLVILGARVYYVIFEWDIYKTNIIEAFKIWNGGLAIHGGIIAGLIYTYFYTKKHHVNTIRLMDIAAPSLILGQALGRWGNFFNQEAFGPIVKSEVLRNLHIPEFIIDGMYINGVYHHPTFFYESVVCLLGFIIMILLRKYYKNLKLGTVSGIYFLIYGIERFFVEGLRQDSLMLGPLKVAQLVSILMVIAGITFIIISIKKNISYIEEEKSTKKKRRKINE